MSERKLISVGERLAVLLLALLMAVTACFSVSAESLDDLREKQVALEEEKAENDALIEKLKSDTRQKKAYREAVYRQIETVQKQLDLLRRQIDDLDERIGQEEDAIAEKRRIASQNLNLLGERIRALYMTGDMPAVAVVLNSRDVLDYGEKLTMLQSIAEADQELIASLQKQIENMEADLAKINGDKAELGEKKKALERKCGELNVLYEEARGLVAEAENQETGAQTGAKLLGSQMKENEEAIAALEEQLRQEGLSGKGSFAGTGNFVWPMPGYTYLTCYFGEGGHRGIDIAGGDIYGKPIIAADSGAVQYAGWNDSYGYCVFIDHGNGYQTRYAHMSEIGIETGMAVEQGDVIGYVGSTGNSTGPHLHFEVIWNDGLTNPMGYF